MIGGAIVNLRGVFEDTDRKHLPVLLNDATMIFVDPEAPDGIAVLRDGEGHFRGVNLYLLRERIDKAIAREGT